MERSFFACEELLGLDDMCFLADEMSMSRYISEDYITRFSQYPTMNQTLHHQRYQGAMPYAQAHSPEDGTVVTRQALHISLRFSAAGSEWSSVSKDEEEEEDVGNGVI